MQARGLTECEADQVIGQLAIPYRQLAVFLVNTGGRLGETLAMLPDDLDLCRRWAIFRVTKSGHERQVPLNVAAAVAAASMMDLRARALTGVGLDVDRHRRVPVWLCHVTAGEFVAIHPRAFQLQLRRAGRRAGIVARVSPHILRHTAATRWSAAGVDVGVIQALLGHKSLRTTQVYLHVTTDRLESAVNAAVFGESLAGRRKPRRRRQG